MIDLELGEHVRWINPETGGWETGTVVRLHGKVVSEAVGVIHDVGLDSDDNVLVAKTYGGLCFVKLGKLERVQMRSEWEATT